MIYTTTVQEKDGEFFIEIPPEVAEALGVGLGDTIYWHTNDDGSFTLTKDPTR